MLPIGTRIPELGEIVGIHLTGGERYYWLNKHRTVTFFPADVVEACLKDPHDYTLASPRRVSGDEEYP